MKSFSVAFVVSAVAMLLLPYRAVPQNLPSNLATTSTLIIRVANVRNTKGVVRFLLFNSPQGWPDDKSKSFRHGSLPANGGTVTFTIPNIPDGSYAISILHDENQDHKLNRDLFGRPKEGIGFANNPKIGFSTPSWKQSSVHVAGASIETDIDLRYP